MMDKDKGRAVLLEIAELLDGLRIPFFLIQGTALGAYRDHGFVPTEKDIDLGILQEDLQPRVTVLLAMLMHLGYDVECFVAPFTRPRTIVAWKDCVHVDLVGFTRWKDKRFTAQPVREWCEDYCLVHDAAMLEDYREVGVFGRTFKIPLDITTYLQREYGDGWSTPQDDHVSRTRVYHYLSQEGIPREYLEGVAQP